MKRLTPIKAIRDRCINCSGYSIKEVRECTHDECPLHQYRFGKRPQEKASATPMKAIRKHCIECCNGNTREANLCTAKTCPLYIYKTGHRPKTDISSIDEEAFKKPHVAPTFSANTGIVGGGEAC